MPRSSPSAATAGRTLVKGLNDGDEAALSALYDEYGERLYDYALSMSGDAKTAAGIVHDTFIDACRRAPRMRDHVHLSAWLYGAARRRCIRQGRAQELYWDRDADFTDAPFSTPPADAAAGDAAVPDAAAAGPDAWPPSGELHELLHASLARLAPADQEVVLLAFRHGLRPARVGGALGLSPRRAAVRVRRGRDALEAALAAELLRVARRCAASAPAASGAAESPEVPEDPDAASVAVMAARDPAATPLAAAETLPPDAGDEDEPSTAPRDEAEPDGSDAEARPGAVQRLRDRADGRRGPLSKPLWKTLHRHEEDPADDDRDLVLDGHISGCAVCRDRARVRAAALLRTAPAPVLPAALRHRVMHTATDPELAGYRADIVARGGALTPDGLPSQPDVPSPFTRRWLWTGGAMAGALAAALVAVVLMGPGLGGNSLSWPPFQTHPDAPVTRDSPAPEPGRGGHAAPLGPQQGGPGRPAAPPVRPQTDERESKVPGSPVPPRQSPVPPTSPPPPAGPGVLAVTPGVIDLDGERSAPIRLAARQGAVTWTAASSTSRLILSQTQGSIAKDGSQQVTVSLRSTLIGLPGEGTLTFTDAQGAARTVSVSWPATIL